MIRFRDWQELPTNFFIAAVIGFALVDGVGGWLLGSESQLRTLEVVRAVELLFLLLLARHFRLFESLGISNPPSKKAWGQGVLIAAICLAVVGLGYLARPDWLAYVGVPVWLTGVEGLLVMTLLAPLVEELFFRGVAYLMLRQLFGVIPAVVVSAILFSMMHGSVEFPQLAGGFIFAIAYEWTRNLWIPILLHMGANTAVWGIVTQL